MTFYSKRYKDQNSLVAAALNCASGLHGLAPFLSELVLEPLLVSSRCLTNLPELSLKVGNVLFFLLGMPRLVGPARSSSMGSVPAGFEGALEGSSWLEGDDPRLTDGFGTSPKDRYGEPERGGVNGSR
jgi:hypothetical protein